MKHAIQWDYHGGPSGDRLAMAAVSVAYGKGTAFTGPTLSGVLAVSWAGTW